MAITKRIPRDQVEPGMMLHHRGHDYRASANTAQHLYIHSLWNVTRISDPEVEVLLDNKGRIEYSPK